MNLGFSFISHSILLGIGLAMDAFSVSVANGLCEPKMRRKKMSIIAGTFGGFQFLMPMTGWVCVHTIVTYFKTFEKNIPWIALILLGFIGGKMIYEGIKGDAEEESISLGKMTLFVQGIATSIDALSVGFTIANYNVSEALICGVIIGAVTFIISIAGLKLGKRFGMILADRAEIFGGIILIGIGIEIFVSNL